jgi:hypothetical protein
MAGPGALLTSAIRDDLIQISVAAARWDNASEFSYMRPIRDSDPLASIPLT